ncbi:PREDICTED: probable LRR receptor-like serine/threonine-protein kinase At5g48740 [Lupinus angustifolius]|uniref:probable LRR receptor-like serine/threonine-protein kinase At5g48740 n=1 Tax=Lupinus angustifolius TaxID=3871 RepID=UPI00092ECD96|nr:PREDICTED: probable LRR receptor-like serine/threonine-protein kinase At5g48740 [Lupinus angustifolius]
MTLPQFFIIYSIIITFFFFFCNSTSTPPSSLYGLSYHINCGTTTNTTDSFNTTWLSDRFFTGGSTAVVSEPLRFHLPSEQTLRYFPSSSYGKKNCYSFPSLPPSSRYLLRTFTVYDNYDAKSRPPSFDVAIAGTILFSCRSPWPESVARDGAYFDLFFSVKNFTTNLCFYGFATDAPIISSMEVIEVDPASYGAVSAAGNILVNYGRISCGSSDQWGPGFTLDTDRFGRSWQPDIDFRTQVHGSDSVHVLSTENAIDGTDREPNFFPMKLYQSAVTVSEDVLEYELSVDAKMDYLVWLHFAEIDSSVKSEGERVFDVLINERNLSRIDIYKEVGSFAAFSMYYTVKNLSSSVLKLKFVTVVGAPLISGIENYALVPNDPSTVPEQVRAMKALKDSLRVPDRMGWNGDPCAPYSWDAWEGVTCLMNKDKAVLVISEIDLGSQGLKGYISDEIGLLSDLVSLNLSSNSLEGNIPSALGQKSLIQLDLSNNQLMGSIPDSLASSSLRLVLLNDNLLEGRVPEEIYSVGVHGGAIDLSGNKDLCGVPSLPSCPMFWEHGGLSTGGKIAISLSCLFVLFVILLVVYFYIKRKKNDYDFGLPPELMSLAAKRNKYQRQKSLMLLELESQHAKGFPSPFTPQ